MPDFGIVTRKRCEIGDCKAECIGQSTAIIIIVITATIACLSSFLKSAGVQLSSAVNIGFHVTFFTFVVLGVWFLAVCINAGRKHESLIWCLIDSFGFPTVLLSLPEVAKYFYVPSSGG